jgi:acetyltransferase-like isoleucine patch superfamily enzyme
VSDRLVGGEHRAVDRAQSLDVDVRGHGSLSVAKSASFEPYVLLDLGNSGDGRIEIGSRSKLKSFSVVRAYNGSVVIGHRVSIGEYCLLAGHGGLVINDHVILGSHCSLTTSEHLFASGCPIRYQGERIAPIVIGEGAWLGAGVRVMAGVNIGRNSVIGAGSVVTKDIPPRHVAYGVPCRVVCAVAEYEMRGFEF